MWCYTWKFDMPFYNFVPYITNRLQLETDFENEANNAENMQRLVKGEPRLAGKIYIPKVYRELTTKRIMTAEWIEGARLWDKEAITLPWNGGRHGSPGARGTQLEPPHPGDLKEKLEGHANAQRLKPDRTQWRGADKKHGLGVSLAKVMTTMVDLFSAQMFLWGEVHCDPHPGNMFVRRLPNGDPELVLIDHGLYIHLEPAFRVQYAQLWKSLLTFDNAAIKRITESWGIGNADLFASAVLLRPYQGGDGSTSARLGLRKGGPETLPPTKEGFTPISDAYHYFFPRSLEAERSFEMQKRMRGAMRDMLKDEALVPRELIFLGRNVRIVQGNNQFLGSPVNRIKLTGMWASRALIDNPDQTFGERLKNYGRHAIFRCVLFTTDIWFWTSKLRHFFGAKGGMEDDLEAQMKKVAKDMAGIELNHAVFEG
jgi:aarF domain-containing kinase